MHASADLFETTSSASDEMGRISRLLGQVRSGDPDALGLVFAEAYGELCAIAQARLRNAGRNAGDGLDITGLVHEVFVRLARRNDLAAENRSHFFRYAATVMRSIIVDGIRRRTALRRGDGAPEALLVEEEVAAAGRDEELLGVQQALEALALMDPQLAEVVQLRVFDGFTELETCQALGLSDRTVRRRWEKARAFLFDTLCA